MKKKVRIILIVLSLILISFYISTVIVYDSIFNYRCTSNTYIMSSVDDYSNLDRIRYEFNTRHNKKLVGYLYSNISVEEKALVVFAHGLGGGGQSGYVEIFNHLTSKGYYVFAYDATANDESEGESVGGLPQGVIDLDYAINFTKTLDEVKELPLMLMGFSWGAYSVSNVLNYQEDVKAVVAIAGWNESLNLIEYNSSKYIGNFSKFLLPFVRVHEFIKYGKYSSSKAMNGFYNTNAKIMIVHSEDDSTVPIEYGYYKYYEKYSNDERFIFKHYTNKGHGDILYNKESIRNYNIIKNTFEKYVQKNNPTESEIIEYINKNVDKKKIAYRLDYSLFNEIVEFYDSSF